MTEDGYMAGDRKRATGIMLQRGGLGRSLWALLLAFGLLAPGAWADNANGEPIGSGDGRIHVIPTLSRPSVKNGEKLSIPIVGIDTVGTTDYPPTRVDALELSPSDNHPVSATIDTGNGYIYFGTTASRVPGQVVKIAVGTSEEKPRRVGALTLESEEGLLGCSVLDPVNGYAYFGTSALNGPGRIVKVSVGEGDTLPTRVGAVTLNHSETRPLAAAIDVVNGYAYFGAGLSLGRVVKVALGEGDAPPTRVGAVTFAPGEKNPYGGVLDPVNGYGYFGALTPSAQGINATDSVVKIALGEGNSSPTRVGGIKLKIGEGYHREALIDLESRFAWFTINYRSTHPGRLVKLKLGENDELPTRVDVASFGHLETYIRGAAIDTKRHHAYFGGNPSGVHFGSPTAVGSVVKFNLGIDDAPPKRIAAVSLQRGEGGVRTAVIDEVNQYAYFGTTSIPAHVVRVALSQQSFVKATRLTLPEIGAAEALRFYSHQAVGNVRLALYDSGSDPALLWESGVIPNTADEDWLSVPVSSGTPELLNLPAGDYWLAWQVDTMADVPSYVPGAANTGFQVPRSFGDFPPSLESGTDTEPTYTSENWSAYIVYDAFPKAVTITPATTGPSNGTSVAFTVDFDEPVQNFDDASDLVIEQSGTASTGATISGGPQSYTVTVDGISGDGSFTLSVNTASDVVDLAGNPLASSVTSVPVVIDNTPPSLTALAVSPSALEPGDEASIQFEVSEMLLGDPLVEVAGMPAAAAPLEAVKSLGHTYLWTAPMGAPVGRITGRPLVPGLGYVNPDPWPYGPQDIEITLTDLAGNTITHTESEGLALVSGLPLAWPGLAILAMIFAATFALRKPGKARVGS